MYLSVACDLFMAEAKGHLIDMGPRVVRFDTIGRLYAPRNTVVIAVTDEVCDEHGTEGESADPERRKFLTMIAWFLLGP